MSPRDSVRPEGSGAVRTASEIQFLCCNLPARFERLGFS